MSLHIRPYEAMPIFISKKINGFVSKTQNRVGCPLDLQAIEASLREMQQAFPKINALLQSRRDKRSLRLTSAPTEDNDAARVESF